MTLRLPIYQNIYSTGDFNITAKTANTSDIKFNTSGNSTPDITFSASGGGVTENTGALELICSTFKIPSVSNWSITQAVDAMSADARYLKSSGDQSVTSDWTFSGSIKVPTMVSTDSSTNAASTAFVTSAISSISGYAKLDSDNTFTGTNTFDVSPIVPTPDSGDSSTKTASTAFVMTELETKANLSGGNTFTGVQLVDAVTDWTKHQIVDASSADSRYLILSDTTTQTVSGNVTFSGTTEVPTLASTDSSTNAASTAFVSSLLSSSLPLDSSLKIEYVSASVSSGDSITFTNAFSASPVLIVPSAQSSTPVKLSTDTWSETGCKVYHDSSSAITIYLLAIGSR